MTAIEELVNLFASAGQITLGVTSTDGGIGTIDLRPRQRAIVLRALRLMGERDVTSEPGEQHDAANDQEDDEDGDEKRQHG